MPLLAIPKRVAANEKELISKVKSSKKSEPKLKLGKDSLLTTITNIKTLVETKLGKYKERYLLVDSEEELNKYIDKILENGICSLDTETTGLNCFQDKVVGASLYTPGQKAIYIPLRHLSYITNELSQSNLDLEVFQRCLKRLESKELKIIYQNAKFDYKMIYNNFGTSLPIYYDTLIAARAINQLEDANLKYQYAKYVEASDEFARFGDLFGKIPFQLVPISSGYIYAAKDAEMTYQLYEKQQEMLKSQPRVKWVLDNIEFPCIWATIALEMNGVLIDLPYAEKLKIKYSKLLEEAEQDAYKALEKYEPEINAYRRLHMNNCKLSNPINLYSPTQLAILLYDILNLNSNDKKNPRGTGEEILVKFKNKFCEKLLACRGYKKLISTYIEAIPNQIEADGRIHARFNQYGTDTGRYSSSDPNLQNIPSHVTDIRPMFSTPNRVKTITTEEDYFEVSIYDDIMTPVGYTPIKGLKIGDIICNDAEKYQIKNILQKDKIMLLYI